MIVMAIIVILLVALVPAINSLGKSSGRKAAIGSLLGTIEQARSNAIKSGRATYVAFPAFSNGSSTTIDRYHYRAFAIFEDDPANPSTPKQLTSWKTLTNGVSLRAKPGVSGSVTDLPDASALTPPATLVFVPESAATVAFHCIKFNANGEIESPPNDVKLTVFEGHVGGATEIVTSSKDANGEPAALESLKIAHLTGRAELTQ